MLDIPFHVASVFTNFSTNEKKSSGVAASRGMDFMSVYAPLSGFIEKTAPQVPRMKKFASSAALRKASSRSGEGAGTSPNIQATLPESSSTTPNT